LDICRFFAPVGTEIQEHFSERGCVMERIILLAALGLLAAGANFGCSQGSSAGKTDSGYCLLPPAANAPGGTTAAGPATGETPNHNKVVNSRSPFTLAQINPNDVPDMLVRNYKGRKIGFCCGGLPETWDKLSEAEKDAKLAEAMGK
jgi:hypothetical protein